MDKIINWNGLPCLQDLTTCKSAIFTNLNSELFICEVENDEIAKETFYHQFEEMGGFECLQNRFLKSSNEFTLVLALTEKCNASCQYCFLDAQHQGEDMSYELIDDSINFAIKLSEGRDINFAAFGGEPSVKPDLVRHMVFYAKMRAEELGISNKIKFSITTNGYFNDAFCDFLIDNNFHISLSMDGIPLVQEKQRKCSVNISQLEKNIKKLANSGTCVLKIRSTITEFSVNYMLESVKYLQSMGVKRIHFEPVTLGGRASINNCFTNQPDAICFSEHLIDCIKYGEAHGIDIICFPYMNINNAPKSFCDGSIKNRLVVGARGTLSTCVEILNNSHPLYAYLGVGSYEIEKKSFTIDANMRRVCRNQEKYDKNKECIECPFNYFCAGGCPSRNYRGTMNSDNISEFRCQIMKNVMPFVLRQFYNKTFNLSN
jgi:radical SAM protein with 4Fe4S-binding SPASM domain